MFKITKKKPGIVESIKSHESKVDATPQAPFFKNIKAYILPSGIGKVRVEIFRNGLLKNGAFLIDENKTIESQLQEDMNFLVVYDETIITSWNDLEKAMSKKIFFTTKNDFKFVNTRWLSDCLRTKSFIDIKDYELRPVVLNKQEKAVGLYKESAQEEIGASNIKKRKINHSPEHYSSDSSNQSFKDLADESEGFTKVDTNTWTCAHSSKDQKVNLNKNITDKLEQLSEIYENTNEKYKVVAYQKAIITLKRHNRTITSYEEAKKVPGIGGRLAEKISEILQTGDLRKLEEMSCREDVAALKKFTNIHGVGPSIAQSFINQGFRTLDDLKTKANLSRAQKIGLKHYDDFLIRIPRDEAAQIEKIVKDIALGLNESLIIDTCGSYRRGKATCGDVDILITHADGHSHQKIFGLLLDSLRKIGFLTDDLAVQEESERQRKYLGVCRLPGEKMLHRRIDIITVPYDEYGCALLYFTGSAHFNRSMRHLAGKMGMSLSEHSLNKNVIRKGKDKIHLGEKMYTPREEDVFKYLNLTYRTPQERDF